MPMLRMLVAAIAVVIAAPLARAQPNKPEEPVLTPATPAVPTIKVTSKKFGSLKIGKKLTIATVKKVFPKSKMSKVKAVAGGAGWRFENTKTGLVAIASPERIDVEAGPVEVHGVMIGDDGAELGGGSFTGAYCYAEADVKDVVTCNKDALVFRLATCIAKPGSDGSIAPDALKGCKVQVISWIAYAQNRD